MDNAPNYDPSDCNLGYDSPSHELDEWLEISNGNKKSKQNCRSKKRRKPLRKNRKPSRPSNYIGQRSNNHLQRIFSD